MALPRPDSFARRADWQVPRYRLAVLHEKRCEHVVVLPVLNEGERLSRQLERMGPYRRACDIVIADAPSTDGSTSVARLSAASVHALVSLDQPGGLSASLRGALDYVLAAAYRGVVFMDGNNKDDPEALPRFVGALEAGADYVQGSRYLPGGRGINTPWTRDLLIRYVHAPAFSLLCGRRFTDTTNGFRAFSSRLLLDPRVRPFRDLFTWYELPYYLAWAACRLGFRVEDVPVTRAYPAGGPLVTKISLFRGHWLLAKPVLDILLRRY